MSSNKKLTDKVGFLTSQHQQPARTALKQQQRQDWQSSPCTMHCTARPQMQHQQLSLTIYCSLLLPQT
jgi:hypothetical protein